MRRCYKNAARWRLDEQLDHYNPGPTAPTSAYSQVRKKKR